MVPDTAIDCQPVRPFRPQVTSVRTPWAWIDVVFGGRHPALPLARSYPWIDPSSVAFQTQPALYASAAIV